MTVRTPKYRLHRPSGQAVVTLDGRDFYLGPHGSDTSRAEFDRLVGEWLANHRRLPSAQAADLSIHELLVAYLRWADGYYRESAEPQNIRYAIRPLAALYGHTPAAEFGPLALKTVRQRMIEGGICRREINKRIGRIVRVFKWAVENELLPGSVLHALRAVAGLRQGRSEARESAPVKPVPDAFIEAIRPRVFPQVWAMIELQRLTGMRPGEVVAIKGCDLNMAGRVWTYEPPRHKTAHHGHRRTIFIGPRAQEVLRPWLKADLTAYLFSPAEAMARLRESQQNPRRTPKARTYAQLLKRDRRARRRLAKARQPADCYTTRSYSRAIADGCRKADRVAHQANPTVPADVVLVPHWHPHQLRHNAATNLRREFGLDVARVILGHRSPAVTEVYAEVDHQKAVEVIGRVG